MTTVYENLTVEQEKLEALLDGVCVRCDAKGFQRRGSSDYPKLRCKTCGLQIGVTSKANIYADLAIGAGLIGAISFILALALLV